MTSNRFVKAGTAWLTDHVIEHWPAYVVLAISGGGTSYAARATSWITSYGPIAWVFCGLAGGLIGLCVYGVFVWLKGQKIEQDLVLLIGKRSGVSPTLHNYEEQRIGLGEFFNPYYIPYRNKVFRRCQVWGPALVFLLRGGKFDRCGFKDVQIVIAKEKEVIYGVIAFESPSFIDCEISNITLVMTRADYNNLPADLRRGMPVIHELPEQQRKPDR